ncbi:hypothetical protein [Amycolatopsis rubida]|uniref:Uncharacterized protein n=1 Tax=Amycolatopsis rubida TaxID=112413 RepID=A0A1I5EZY5_9PSEU|nr:hypothetical protein [Amycolatopsis rubida]SFO17027.1 hypothetical protein SAMN05421854_101879 [Amycolatopsis rubida]
MDEIVHWLLAQLYNGIDLAVPWWPVRYTAYVVATAALVSFLARRAWKVLFRVQWRVSSHRVSLWWTVRLGGRLLRVGGARPGQIDAVPDSSRTMRACWRAGQALAPPHIPLARLERHAFRAVAVNRVLAWGARLLFLAGRWNTMVSLATAMAAAMWLRPPWVSVPEAWRQIVEMYVWTTNRPLPSVLGAITAVVAVVVVASRGGLLDRLR